MHVIDLVVNDSWFIFLFFICLRQWFSTGGARPHSPGGARVGYRMGEKKKLEKKIGNFFLSLHYCHKKL